tara:strand:+ start:441 stop:671 length:231 start_codon:yes stop_codon:yes gene_type:complete
MEAERLKEKQQGDQPAAEGSKKIEKSGDGAGEGEETEEGKASRRKEDKERLMADVAASLPPLPDFPIRAHEHIRGT